MESINVTKAFLPPQSEYQELLNLLWDSHHITNQGIYTRRLDEELKSYLGVQNFTFVSNGTIAIQLALRALKIHDGEIITTPFTYVATANSILWEHCQPVFVDIDPTTLCIDPSKIEARITSKTRAILPVHVYGIPCDVQSIELIARNNKLHLIYDAAHAFGVKYKGRSLLCYGDIATCSFHATKVFHTVEGGALVTHDKKIADRIDLLRRFGHNGDDYYTVGINAKNSEFHAAMGLANLKHFENIVADRMRITERYNNLLGSLFLQPEYPEGTERNFAYYPIITKCEQECIAIINALNRASIFPRRYFYPSLNTLDYLNIAECPISESVSKRILCLPLYYGLSIDDQTRICNIILETTQQLY